MAIFSSKRAPGLLLTLFDNLSAIHSTGLFYYTTIFVQPWVIPPVAFELQVLLRAAGILSE